jgi:hypothetical protein
MSRRIVLILQEEEVAFGSNQAGKPTDRLRTKLQSRHCRDERPAWDSELPGDTSTYCRLPQSLADAGVYTIWRMLNSARFLITGGQSVPLFHYEFHSSPESVHILAKSVNVYCAFRSGGLLCAGAGVIAGGSSNEPLIVVALKS